MGKITKWGITTTLSLSLSYHKLQCKVVHELIYKVLHEWVIQVCTPNCKNDTKRSRVWAIWPSLQFNLDIDFHRMLLKSKSLQAVNLINDESGSLVMEENMVKDVRNLILFTSNFSCNYCPLRANYTFHNLAKFDLIVSNYITLIENELDWLLPILIKYVAT